MHGRFELNSSELHCVLLFLLVLWIFLIPSTLLANSLILTSQDSVTKLISNLSDTTHQILQDDSIAVKIVQDTIKLDTTQIDTQVIKPPKKIKKAKFILRTESDASIDTTWRLERGNFAILIHEDLGDLIKHLPGINLYDPVSTGQPTYAGFHGSTPEQMTVLVNGCPISHDQFGAIDLNCLPVEEIQRIEVVRDPTDIPYAGFGGSIKLLTQKFKGGNRPRTHVMYHKGVRNYSDVDVMFGQKLTRDTNFNAGIIYKNCDGYYNHSKYDAQKFRNQITSYLGSNWLLNYFLLYNKSDVDLPGGISPDDNSPATPKAHEKIVRYDHAINLRGNIFADSTEDISLHIYYTSQYKEFRDRPNAIDETNRYGFGGLRVETYLPFRNQFFTFGGDYQYRYMHSTEMGRRHHHRAMLYLRDVVPLFSGIHLKFLTRFEYHNMYHSFFSPSVTLERHQNFPNKIAIHYSSTQRVPTFFESYRDNKYWKGNPDLKPEKGSSIDIVLSTKIFDALDIKSDLFLRKINEPIRMIAFPESTRAIFINHQEDEFYGADAELFWRNHDKWAAGIHFNLLFAYDANNEHLPDLPLFSGIIYFDFFQNFFKNDLKLHGRFNFRLFGPRWSHYLIPNSSPYIYSASLVKFTTDPVMDFKVVGEVIQDVQLFLSIENILNRQYQQKYGYPMRGRTLHWGLTWKFWD